jgi:biotin carboxylase
MKKIMILGASILQLPAILKAKEMGLQVIAVDMDNNAVGFKHADVCLEISTIDIQRIVEAAKQYKIDGVMTLASDMPMRTVAAVAKELNLIGISEETAIVATNKAKMREKLFEHGVPIPKFYVANSFEEYIRVTKKFSDKFIVKPVDNSGSRGVFLVTNSDEVEHAYIHSKKYSRNGEIVVEDYMQGHEVSVETLTINGNTHIIAITDKLTTGSPNFVEMGHSQPSILCEEITNEIEKTTTAAVNALGIENGPSHTEIIVTKEGPKIVELGARLGGDNITTHLVPLSTGVDMVDCCIKIALGMEPDNKPKFKKGSAIRYFESSEGRIVNIKGIEKANLLNGVKQITFTKKVGDKINNINSSIDRIGFVIAQSNTGVNATSICMEALKLINISVR